MRSGCLIKTYLIVPRNASGIQELLFILNWREVIDLDSIRVSRLGFGLDPVLQRFEFAIYGPHFLASPIQKSLGSWATSARVLIFNFCVTFWTQKPAAADDLTLAT